MKGTFHITGLEGKLHPQKHYQLKFSPSSNQIEWTKLEKNGKKEKTSNFTIKEDWLNGGAMLFFTEVGEMANVTIYGISFGDYKNMNSLKNIYNGNGYGYDYWTDHASTLCRIILSDY